MAVVERVGHGCEARPEGRGRGGGGCTLEEAVVVGRQWERTETVGLRKGEGTGEEESCQGRIERGGRGRQSRIREMVEVGVKNPTRN